MTKCFPSSSTLILVPLRLSFLLLLLLANYFIYSMETPCISQDGPGYAAVTNRPQNLDLTPQKYMPNVNQQADADGIGY